MVNPERLQVYLETLMPEEDPVLQEIEAECLAAEVPIVRRDARDVMRALLALHRPGTVLEIGTAHGFSSVFFCKYSWARVTTIENYEKRFETARENFRRAGCEDRITFLTGDAEVILPTLTGPYDLIFLDAAQGQYIAFLPELLRLLRDGGLLLTDNVLIGGDLLESHYAVERRKRTIYKRMREYLRAITESEELTTAVLPVGDGLAVSVKQCR